MAEQLPYVPSYGLIGKVLETAATPPRFTHDFLSTKLGMTGGSARSLIPFPKRVGFLGTDGAPTDLYKRFRNPAIGRRHHVTPARGSGRALGCVPVLPRIDNHHEAL